MYFVLPVTRMILNYWDEMEKTILPFPLTPDTKTPIMGTSTLISEQYI